MGQDTKIFAIEGDYKTRERLRTILSYLPENTIERVGERSVYVRMDGKGDLELEILDGPWISPIINAPFNTRYERGQISFKWNGRCYRLKTPQQ